MHRTGRAARAVRRPLRRVSRRGGGPAYGTRAKPRTEPAAFSLLRDLRELYLQAHAAEISWVALVQTAKAIRDADLVEVATNCQQEVETCGKWQRTRIKESSPQVFATS